MMSGVHISEIEVFGHGFFQDILTLMRTLDVEELTREDVIRYKDQLLGRAGGGTRVDRSKPCKGCKDKKK